jgi:cell division protein FtsB
MEAQKQGEQMRQTQAVATANAEIVQLRKTVQTLRDQIEEQKAVYLREVEAVRAQERREIQHLKDTIQTLRRQMEEMNAGR